MAETHRREELGFVPFEPVEHTADLALVARGRTLAELFEHTALGMLRFLYDGQSVRAVETSPLAVTAPDLEELLVVWLQELLYRHEVHHRLYAGVRVESLVLPTEGAPASLRATLIGEERDPARHALGADIKAATYHGLEITQERTAAGPEVYRVRVVFDL